MILLLKSFHPIFSLSNVNMKPSWFEIGILRLKFEYHG